MMLPGGTMLKKSRWLALAVLAVILLASCGRSDGNAGPATTTGGQVDAGFPIGDISAEDVAAACETEPLEASEVGITAETITIEVMADTGSPLAPGFAQGNVDAITGYADYVNAHGGIGCRQLVVRTWDSKFDPAAAKDGQIDACTNAFAMVGSNSIFNPDIATQDGCVDKSGSATGLPDVAALAVDTNEMCSPMTIGVNTRAEGCPIATNTARDITRMEGPFTWLLQEHGDLHGVYLVSGDLPSTKNSAPSDIAAQEAAGITFDAKPVQSATEAQSAYLPRIAPLQAGANYVYDGAADFALSLYMKEAIAQGVDTSQIVWACSVACYTDALLETGGNAVDGAYAWIQFLPFFEADSNAALAAYIDTVGTDKIDTWGATSWQAAIAFNQVVNQIVVEKGPNALTRANLIDGLNSLTDFDAAGMTGPHDLGEQSPCYLMVQVQDGEFKRVHPTEAGSFDCDESNLVTVNVNSEGAAADLG